MFKRILMTVVAVVIVMSVFVSPVEAKPERDWTEIVPSAPYGWDFHTEPASVTLTPFGYWGSISFKFAMPPVDWEVTVDVYKDGEPYQSFDGITFDGDNCSMLWRSVLINESDPPESITYTFVLSAKGKTITEDVVVYFD
jgi:hypothetical protein